MVEVGNPSSPQARAVRDARPASGLVQVPVSRKFPETPQDRSDRILPTSIPQLCQFASSPIFSSSPRPLTAPKTTSCRSCYRPGGGRFPKGSISHNQSSNRNSSRDANRAIRPITVNANDAPNVIIRYHTPTRATRPYQPR